MTSGDGSTAAMNNQIWSYCAPSPIAEKQNRVRTATWLGWLEEELCHEALLSSPMPSGNKPTPFLAPRRDTGMGKTFLHEGRNLPEADPVGSRSVVWIEQGSSRGWKSRWHPDDPVRGIP